MEILNQLICQMANVGNKADWIKLGLNSYNWNYLLLLTTNEKKYIEIAQDFKTELEKSTKIETDIKLDSKSIKPIEILIIPDRKLINFISTVKRKLKDIRNKNYRIFYNATSGLQVWKFAIYFIYTEEDLIDKFFYYPIDSPEDQPISPIEFYKPLKVSSSLKTILGFFSEKTQSLDDLIERYQSLNKKTATKGLISRYLNELKNLGLVEESEKKIGKKKLFRLTEKGKWFS